jgi:uncharacterized repeat protein (TIGR03803 family)
MRHVAITLALGFALCASRAESQTFKTLVQFTGTGGTASGLFPTGSLTLSGTTLYGTTDRGGVNGLGNIFSVGIDGTSYKNLISFTGAGGSANGSTWAEYQFGKLTFVGGTLYGMTSQGGIGVGNIFSVNTNGTNYQNVLSFGAGTVNGNQPYGSLTPSGTTLFGMTEQASPFGNVFSVGTDGTNYKVLLSFTGSGGAAVGELPVGRLTLSGSTLYGMTPDGGVNHDGNIFSVGADGTSYQNLISFASTGGSAFGFSPQGSLTLSGTTLYGMTAYGGAHNDGTVFSVGTNGTNFQNLLSFTGTSGAFPYGSLTLNGTTLYGMTRSNIFSVGIDGSGYQDLYEFTGGADGTSPYGDLTLSGGTLFGMTGLGGANGDGTVFALSLAPTPEPGTLALVGCGAAALVSYGWRRRRRPLARARW